MLNNMQLIVNEKNEYKVSRLEPKKFSEEIIIKSEQTVLKNYVYINSYRVIA